MAKCSLLVICTVLRNLRFHVAVITALMYGFTAQAEVSLGFAMSHHSFSDNGYEHNDKHIVLDWEHEYSGLYAAYIHKNSYYDPAVTGGYLWQTKWLNGKLEPEIYVGMVYGYDEHITVDYAGVSPYGWFGLEYLIDSKLSVKLRAIPEIYTLGIEYNF